MKRTSRPPRNFFLAVPTAGGSSLNAIHRRRHIKGRVRSLWPKSKGTESRSIYVKVDIDEASLYPSPLVLQYQHDRYRPENLLGYDFKGWRFPRSLHFVGEWRGRIRENQALSALDCNRWTERLPHIFSSSIRLGLSANIGCNSRQESHHHLAT
jgi:hypothetical protein